MNLDEYSQRTCRALSFRFGRRDGPHAGMPRDGLRVQGLRDIPEMKP